MINVAYWIKKTPQPSALLADDNRIEIPRNRRAWKDIAATVAALEPSKLTALDADGHIIRSVVLDDASDASDASDAKPSAGMSDVQLFARLLAEAYEKGSKSTQPVIDAAMKFVEAGSQRALKADHEIDRLRAVIHKQHLQIAELTGSAAPAGDESVLGALVAGAMQAAGGGGGPLAVVGKAAAKK